jgi:hypothetical protein
LDYSEKDEQDDNNEGHSNDCLKYLKRDMEYDFIKKRQGRQDI